MMSVESHRGPVIRLAMPESDSPVRCSELNPSPPSYLRNAPVVLHSDRDADDDLGVARGILGRGGVGWGLGWPVGVDNPRAEYGQKRLAN